MLAQVVARLSCPHCDASLAEVASSLICVNGHCFDIARQGYASLLLGYTNTGTADTAAMVTARERALSSPAYKPLIDAVAEDAVGALTNTGPGMAIDVAAGTGRYLAAVLDRAPSRVGLATDLSKYAARRAARAHERASAIVCDAWGRLPVQSGSAALLLSVFGPKNAEEFARVLTSSGRLLTVTPTASHLGELVERLGLITVDPDKEHRLARILEPRFDRAGERLVEYRVVLDPEVAAAVALMGPSGARAKEADLKRRAAALGPVEVTVSVRVGIYRPL